jgi:hypothetical protein
MILVIVYSASLYAAPSGLVGTNSGIKSMHDVDAWRVENPHQTYTDLLKSMRTVLRGEYTQVTNT